MDKIWPPVFKKMALKVKKKGRFWSTPAKQFVVLENVRFVTVSMPYLIFIITLWGELWWLPYFSENHPKMRASMTLGITSGQALKVGQWQSSPSDFRTGALSAMLELHCGFVTRAGDWGSGKECSGLHRTSAQPWRCANGHGVNGEEKQKPNQKFRLWFHYKDPWIPSSGVWVLCCGQCCWEQTLSCPCWQLHGNSVYFCLR